MTWNRRQLQRPVDRERRSGRDRRQDARVPFAVPVELVRGAWLYLHFTSDLSVGGAYFDRAVPFRPGTRVELRFHLPDGGPRIRCTGEVMPRSPEGGSGMGVRFLDLSPEAAWRVDRLCRVTRAAAGLPPH